MTLWRPRRCNCLIWAAVQWWCHGGRVRAVGSIYGWWPHWLWHHNGDVYEYAPIVHRTGLLSAPILFRGRAQEVIGERIIRIVRAGRDVIAEQIDRLEVD